MDFLVNISIELPPDVHTAEADALRHAEATRADQLAAEGRLVRLWRVPGEWANWGLWSAKDRVELETALQSLPLHPYMHIVIHPLDLHPSDPGDPHGNG